jgi:hypothetical protein
MNVFTSLLGLVIVSHLSSQRIGTLQVVSEPIGLAVGRNPDPKTRSKKKLPHPQEKSSLLPPPPRF